MDHRNIFAHTDPALGYPEYLSINERGGKIQITVRGPRVGDAEGPQATMNLPPDKLRALVHALIAEPIRDTSSSDQVREATPEMIEAGAKALLGFYADEIKAQDESAERLARLEAAKCWRAMAAALVAQQ